MDVKSALKWQFLSQKTFFVPLSEAIVLLLLVTWGGLLHYYFETLIFLNKIN